MPHVDIMSEPLPLYIRGCDLGENLFSLSTTLQGHFMLPCLAGPHVRISVFSIEYTQHVGSGAGARAAERCEAQLRVSTLTSLTCWRCQMSGTICLGEWLVPCVYCVMTHVYYIESTVYSKLSFHSYSPESTHDSKLAALTSI